MALSNYSESGKPASDSTILSVHGLKTWFETDEGTVKAVDGVDFDLPAGRTLAIVGESGCGKSITARSILRLIDPPGRIVDGQILLRERSNTGSSATLDLAALRAGDPRLRKVRGGRIALVFQEPMASFSPVHTVGSQITEAIRWHQPVDRAAARSRAIELLATVGVPEPEVRVDRYPHELSGGLLQRAMIAMALSSEPDILIADEPTTALDVTTQAQILALLRRLQRERSMAVILITHDLGVVAQVADLVLVMYLGRTVESGTVEQIFDAPKHPYLQALLRSVLHTRGGPRREHLATIEGMVPPPTQRPSGCPFHNRCDQVLPDQCHTREPRLLPVSEGDPHQVSCFLYHES